MVVSPRAELKGAVLLVKREITNFDFTGRFVDGRRKPVHLAVVGDDSVGVERDLVGPVSAGRGDRVEDKSNTNTARTLEEIFRFSTLHFKGCHGCFLSRGPIFT